MEGSVQQTTSVFHADVNLGHVMEGRVKITALKTQTAAQGKVANKTHIGPLLLNANLMLHQEEHALTHTIALQTATVGTATHLMRRLTQ